MVLLILVCVLVNGISVVYSVVVKLGMKNVVWVVCCLVCVWLVRDMSGMVRVEWGVL